MPLRKLMITPRSARNYLFFALVFLCLPSLLTFYFPSHQGRLLVASGASQDAVFSRSVIFMTMHNAFGAAGVIMNRPLMGVELDQAKARFPKMVEFRYGGPMLEPSEYFWLVPDVDEPNGFEILSPQDLQQNSPERYNAIIGDNALARQVVVFRGYAGWAPMQLNREIYYGGWNAVDYDPALVFGSSFSDMWSKALKRVLREKKVSVAPI